MGNSANKSSQFIRVGRRFNKFIMEEEKITGDLTSKINQTMSEAPN